MHRAYYEGNLKLKKFDIKDLRCPHRHSIQSHPACFMKGLVKYPDPKTFEKYTGKPWYEYSDDNGNPLLRIGFFDIEVDDLKPDRGMVLTWAIKERNGNVITSYITRQEIFDGVFDKRVVQEFVDAISKFDILVGYYSSRFDINFMRARAMYHNIEFPSMSYCKDEKGEYKLKPEIIHWDIYYIVRNKLGLSRNSLANSTQFLGIPGKTPIDFSYWMKARFGDKKCIEIVLEHNIADVEITEKLWERLTPYKKWIKSPL